MHYRRHKLAEQLRIEISSILTRELRDRIRGIVTITTVQVSPDLRHARILYSFLGSPAEKQETLAALDEAAGFIRRLIGARIRLRHTPDLVFVYDQSIEQGDRMMQIIEEIKKELPEEEPPKELC